MTTFLSFDDQPVRLVKGEEVVFELPLSQLMIIYHLCNEKRKGDTAEDWFMAFRDALSEKVGKEISPIDAVSIGYHVAAVAYSQKKSFG